MYLRAADAFVEVFETSKSTVEKTRSKTEAAKALERAAKLKKVHPNLKPPPKNPFSPSSCLETSYIGGILNLSRGTDGHSESVL